MNLLEEYITEVISVEPYTPKWLVSDEWVKVKWVLNGYGGTKEHEDLLIKSHFEECLEQGYILK